jgi:hypothetical protein
MRVTHVLRKPLSEGNVAANVLKHGCGGMNIDSARIAYPSGKPESGWSKSGSDGEKGYLGTSTFKIRACSAEEIQERVGAGRWPANMILQHADGCRSVGTRKVQGTRLHPVHSNVEHSEGWRSITHRNGEVVQYGDENGTEVIEAWDCEAGCPVAGLDWQTGVSGSTTEGVNLRGEGGQFHTPIYENGPGPQGRTSETRRRIVDTGGASRFFKQIGSKT